jgi:ATP-dependent RNA helicase DeaD
MSAVPAAESISSISFRDLALSEPVLRALADVGYESPSPIQAATIPVLLSGADMLGQAQTGTGKTGAFALPALSRIDLSRHEPQVLVLVPTRELALQVAEAFQRYAAHIKGFHVLPIYGGQSYQPQLNALRRGVHVVVGTPGRVIDHMNRGTLKLTGLTLLVLDEADEMLRMGFVDAVESILEQTPPQRQVALFSATIPAPIRRIAARHLRSPVEVTIKSKTSTATNIRQRYWLVSGMHKLDALTRILEAEPFDGMLVFTRTKQATVELAEKLEARGFAAAPLNGDIPQQQRERTVARLKAGQIDILVATDVAARGLDVDRIGHVVNYDVPYDTESYVHRIGRTGRAGRSGEAILFIAPRERNMLRAIERATRQTIEPMNLPSVDAVNTLRIAKFKQRIAEAVAKGDSTVYRPVLEQLEIETGLPLIDIAAALASLAQGTTPLLLAGKAERPPEPVFPTGGGGHVPAPARGPARPATDQAIEGAVERPARARGKTTAGEMETFRIEVGSVHGIKPGNVVGAIANEAGIEGVHIGRVDIREDHSFVDLPEGMPAPIFKELQKVRVAGRELRISRVSEKTPKPARAARHKPGPRKLLTRR